MAQELFEVSVPGSLMLMGEHAVLYGKQAIVCSVDKRLNMQLVSNTTQQITICDTRLGTLTQELNNLQVQAPFKFVLQAILQFKECIKTGFTLNISSEFSSVIGFGSSAAVTVATVAILGKWLNIPLSSEQLYEMAYELILGIQKCGSGADVAASVFGGVISYDIGELNHTVCVAGDAEAGVPRSHAAQRVRMGAPGCSGRTRKHINKMQIISELTVIYSGYKTPTPEVIKIVRDAQQREPEKFAKIFAEIESCTEKAITALQNADWPSLGKLFLQHHALQAELGTSDPVLDQLVETLSKQPQIYGAKISGAGLGDCVIGLGRVDSQLIPANDNMLQMVVNISAQGLTYVNN